MKGEDEDVHAQCNRLYIRVTCDVSLVSFECIADGVCDEIQSPASSGVGPSRQPGETELFNKSKILGNYVP